MKTIQKIGLAGAVAVLALSFIFPASAELSREGITTIAVLISFLVILITEALPIIVASLIYIALMPVLGAVKSFPAALTGYASPVIFFTLASFGIAAAFTAIPLSKRMLRAMLRVFGGSVKSFMFAIMLCAALVSSCVSNVPTCAVFMAIGLSFLELYSDEAERRHTGRALMIAIPVASMIGGMMTPAGSSINILAIGLLEDITGKTISFVSWMAAGIPLTILILPVAWFLMVRIYKPAEIDSDRVSRFAASLDVPKRMTDKEIKVVVVTAIMLVLWVLSSWFPKINVMIVAVLGCCAMFLPGMRVLDVKDFLRENSWDSFFLVGTIISIGNAVVANGVSDFIISKIPALQLSLPLLIAFIVCFTFAALLVVPVATSLVTVLAAPVIAIALGSSQSPALLIMTLALCAGNCYLLPLDTVTLLTYGKGYYKMTDMAKSTLPLQLWVALAMSLWIPVVGRLFM